MNTMPPMESSTVAGKRVRKSLDEPGVWSTIERPKSPLQQVAEIGDVLRQQIGLVIAQLVHASGLMARRRP